jgi:hypothetical protein
MGEHYYTRIHTASYHPYIGLLAVYTSLIRVVGNEYCDTRNKVRNNQHDDKNMNVFLKNVSSLMSVVAWHQERQLWFVLIVFLKANDLLEPLIKAIERGEYKSCEQEINKNRSSTVACYYVVKQWSKPKHRRLYDNKNAEVYDFNCKIWAVPEH